MNWQEFEDRLGAAAAAHQTPVDTDALWVKIREKRRRRFFFWLLGGCGLLVMVYFARHTPAFSDNAGAVVRTDTTMPAHTPIAPAAEISSSRELFPTAKQPFHDHRAAKYTTQQTAPRSTGRTGPPANPPLATVLDPQQYGVHPPVQARQTNIDKSAKQSDIPGSMTGIGSGQVPSHTTPASAPENIDSSRAADRQPTGALPAFDTPAPGFPKPAALLWLFHPFIPLTLPIPAHPTPRATPPSARPVKKANALYVGLQTGYFTWRIRTDSLPAFRNGEKTLAATQIVLQAQLPLGQYWALRTGVQYTQYQSVFRWTNNWTVFDTLTPVLNYYVNGNVDTTYSAGSYQYERKVQHYNRLQALAIPLDLQYRLALGKRSLKPFVGVQVQLWQRADGMILKDLEPDVKEYRNTYHNALNLGLRFGLSLEAPLGPKTRVFLEPAGQLDLLRRTAQTYPAERFRQWGVHVGVLRQW